MNIVRELRMKKGIQQKELAIEIGVTNATVSDWEHGRKNPSGERLRKLADFFDVSPSVILGNEPYGEKKLITTSDPEICGVSYTDQIVEQVLEKLGKVDIQPRTNEARLVSGAMDRMSPADRERALNMMKAVYSDYFDKAEDKIS